MFNNIINNAQEWWLNNSKVIKTGVTCAMVGIAYGFVKGMVTSNEMWMDHGYSLALDGIEESSRVNREIIVLECGDSCEVDEK